jgi:hypothetical protein
MTRETFCFLVTVGFAVAGALVALGLHGAGP